MNETMNRARRGLRPALLATLLLLSPLHGLAAPDEAAQEQRYQRLAQELRCVVCQNQSLADSPAGLALDLKQLLREQLAQGASDEQALDYLVARYGEGVLYRPRLQARTALLWFGPLLVLGLALQLLAGHWRRRPASDETEAPAATPAGEARP